MGFDRYNTIYSYLTACYWCRAKLCTWFFALRFFFRCCTHFNTPTAALKKQNSKMQRDQRTFWHAFTSSNMYEVGNVNPGFIKPRDELDG